MDRTNAIRIIDKHSYNCAGYALGTFMWENFPEAEKPRLSHNRMLEAVLNRFPLKEITKAELQKLPRNVEVVAMSTSVSYNDFHFMRRATNGIWYHKRGWTSAIHTITQDKVLAGRWCGIYGKRVTFFVWKNDDRTNK